MVVKSEWIHPDRLWFIPEAKMKQFRNKEQPSMEIGANWPVAEEGLV